MLRLLSRTAPIPTQIVRAPRVTLKIRTHGGGSGGSGGAAFSSSSSSSNSSNSTSKLDDIMIQRYKLSCARIDALNAEFVMCAELLGRFISDLYTKEAYPRALAALSNAQCAMPRAALDAHRSENALLALITLEPNCELVAKTQVSLERCMFCDVRVTNNAVLNVKAIIEAAQDHNRALLRLLAPPQWSSPGVNVLFTHSEQIRSNRDGALLLDLQLDVQWRMRAQIVKDMMATGQLSPAPPIAFK